MLCSNVRIHFILKSFIRKHSVPHNCVLQFSAMVLQRSKKMFVILLVLQVTVLIYWDKVACYGHKEFIQAILKGSHQD